MKMNLKDRIQEYLETNDFSKLEELYRKTEPKKFEDGLSSAAFENKTLVSYTFLCMLLIKEESLELHIWASALLMHPLCIIDGAYASALYHVRKAIHLDPDNLGLKEFLIFLHEVPDRVVDKKEAISVARAILKEEPENKWGKDLLEWYSLDR